MYLSVDGTAAPLAAARSRRIRTEGSSRSPPAPRALGSDRPSIGICGRRGRGTVEVPCETVVALPPPAFPPPLRMPLRPGRGTPIPHPRNPPLPDLPSRDRGPPPHRAHPRSPSGRPSRGEYQRHPVRFHRSLPGRGGVPSAKYLSSVRGGPMGETRPQGP
jgi:hypothetical protein